MKVTDVGRKLEDVVQVIYFSLLVTIRFGAEPLNQWLTTGMHVEILALQQVLEMLNRKLNRQNFAGKAAAARLSSLEILREQ